MPSIYQPRGVFRGLTVVQLNELITQATSDLSSGRFTSTSGGGKSSTVEYDLTPSQILIEAQFSLDILGGIRRASRVYSDMQNA